MRKVLLLGSLILWSLVRAQNLAELELQLKTRMDQLRAAKTPNEINKINALFTKEMGVFLRKDGAFQFQFSQLQTIADLKSDDGLLRIVHWNLEYPDFTYSYSGFIMKVEEETENCKVFDLIDVTDPFTLIPEQQIDSKSWYGALYYKIIPIEYNNEIQYVLLGWDGATSSSTFKVIDVLVFKGNAAKFGSPVFVNKNKVSKRVIFEYADKSAMSLQMDEKRDRIVFDHLSPETPALTGIYSYYVPDFSYDSYNWEDDRFVLHEDVIAINKEENTNESSIYVMDPKTGKVKKESYRLKWISPEDKSREGDISHVARTPESETIIEQNDGNENEVPRKRWWDRRNPNNLSVTTGKYRKNRHRPPQP